MGIFIVIDVLIDQYEVEGIISVYFFVRRMWKDRIVMVWIVKQYIFIYEVIFEVCVVGDMCVGFDLKEKYYILIMCNLKMKYFFFRD